MALDDGHCFVALRRNSRAKEPGCFAHDLICLRLVPLPVVLRILARPPRRFPISVGVPPALLNLVFVLRRIEALKQRLRLLLIHFYFSSFGESSEGRVHRAKHRFRALSSRQELLPLFLEGRP